MRCSVVILSLLLLFLLLHLLGVLARMSPTYRRCCCEQVLLLLLLEGSLLGLRATLRELHLVDVAKMLLHHGHAVRVFLRVASMSSS